MRRFLILAMVLAAASAVVAQEPSYQGPGRVDLDLMAGPVSVVGRVIVHNNNGGLIVDVETLNGWHLNHLQIHVGWEDDPVPVTKKGNPIPGHFHFQYDYHDGPQTFQNTYFDFDEDLNGFHWGQPWEEQRLRHMAIHADVVRVDANGHTYDGRGAWAGDLAFPNGPKWARWFLYPFTHKQSFHIVDSPVKGLRVITPTENELTDESGKGWYFPGEEGDVYLGYQHLGRVELEHKVYPMDFFPTSDVDDSGWDALDPSR